MQLMQLSKQWTRNLCSVKLSLK